MFMKATPNYTDNFYLAKRLFKNYVFPYKFKFFLSILMFVVAGTTAYHAYLVKPALDEVFVNQNTNALIIVPLIIIFVTIIKAISSYFQMLLMKYVNIGITADLRKELYNHFIYSRYFNLKQIIFWRYDCIDYDGYWKSYKRNINSRKWILLNNS